MLFQPSTKSSELRPGIIYIHGGGWVLMKPGKLHYQLSIKTCVRLCMNGFLCMPFVSDVITQNG